MNSALKQGNVTNRPGTHNKMDPKDFQISKLKKQLADARRQPEPQKLVKPVFEISEEGINLSSALTVDGKTFKSFETVFKSDEFSKLLPLIKPIVILTNGLMAGRDILKRSPRFALDSNGLRTNTIARDENGKVLSMPSLTDKVTDIYNIMLSDPKCKELINGLNDRIGEIRESSIQKIEKPSVKPDPLPKKDDHGGMGY